MHYSISQYLTDNAEKTESEISPGILFSNKRDTPPCIFILFRFTDLFSLEILPTPENVFRVWNSAMAIQTYASLLTCSIIGKDTLVHRYVLFVFF